MHDVAESPETIRDFWFGWEPADADVASAKSDLWWSKEPATDRLMRKRFGSSVGAAAQGRLDAWSETPGGRLALILLTDQFPRNAYRGTRRAFAYDGKARSWCRSGLRQGVDASLRPIERVFFYMPLQHSENPVDQEASVLLFEKLARQAPEAARSLFETYLAYAVRHREIIERFARFPHRNAILGRHSTAEEVEFLKQPGSSF